MNRLNRFLFLIFCSIFPAFLIAQKSTKHTAPLDSTRDSHTSVFRVVGVTDTTKAIVRVQVKEIGSETPVQGATVLLRRDVDKILGRVTKADGRCNFMPAPATYVVRTQLTGYKTYESPGFEFERGKVYELVIRVARN